MKTINLGMEPNDGTGDGLRVGGEKINENFAEVDQRLTDAEEKAAQVDNFASRIQTAELDITSLRQDQNSQEQDLTGLGTRVSNLENQEINEVPTGGLAGQVLTQSTTGPFWGDVDGGEGAKNLTNVLTNRKFGRYKTRNISSAFTCQVIMELETEFYAIRVGIPNLADHEVSMQLIVSVGNGFQGPSYQAHPNLPGGGWMHQKTVVLAPRIDNHIASVTYTDLMVLKSIPRVDGGIRPLIGIRMEYLTGPITVPYQDFYGWRSMSESAPGDRPMRVSSQDGQGVSDQSLYTTTTSIDTNAVIPIVEYYTVKAGKQLMFVGDSTVEGAGGNTRAWGSFERASAALSTVDNPVEYYNCGLHSLGSSIYQKTIAAYAPDVLPTHLFYYPLTVNDIPVVGGINNSTLESMYSGIANALARAKELKVIPKIALFGSLPYNTAFKDSGAADAIRREINEWISTFTGTQFIGGYPEVFSGPENAEGQTTIKAGLTNDNVHPNDAGYEALENEAVRPFMESFL